MPSPFVGMDPFLEDPALFPDLHDSLIFCLREALNARLPASYYAGIGSRVWVETSLRRIGPDVKLHVPHDEIRENFLDIYAQDGDRLVTTLEVLSLTNKTPGEHGRDLYLKKQQEILASKVHLVEIDLLRGGRHATAVPRELMLAKVGPLDYHVCIHHFDNLEDFFVYPVGLGTRLPTIAVPLLPGDGAVCIDLQPILDRCYDTGQYLRRVRYRDRKIVPPLSAEQMRWADEVLREKGLLSA